MTKQIKRCKRCDLWLPLDSFAVRFAAKRKHQSVVHYCLKCEEEIKLERKEKNKWVYLKRYGLTPEDYERMVRDQNGRCTICNYENDGKKLVVDHCHKTGKVRALLCDDCNQGLGRFFDRPDWLEKAAAYVRAHERSN